MSRQVRRAQASRRSEGSTLWGDGFACDGLPALSSVRGWHLVSPDEYILLFPRLLEEAIPAVIRSNIEVCVAVRAWRMQQADASGPALRLHSERPASNVGMMSHDDWFAGEAAAVRLLRRLGLLKLVPGRRLAERSVLTVLDGILCAIQRDEKPRWSLEAEVLLAFGAGVHPAYVWPEAALSHARGTTAGWLGFLDRGRPALMPLVVAEYLTEVTDVVDSRFLELAGGPQVIERLRRTARRRLAGENPVVRSPPRSALAGPRIPGWPSLSWSIGVEA